MAAKKTPERLCIGCNQMKPKTELWRIVKNKEGEISVDFNGKAQGRGAYICRDINCLLKAQKSRRLERAFGGAIDSEIYDTIKRQIEKGE